MKKFLAMLVATLAVAALGAVPAFAETLENDTAWTVAFTRDAKMDSNFKTADIDEFIAGMQPGDTALITVNLKNDNPSATDWYMTNKVISSLEESATSANGGAYTYKLTYIDPKGAETVLFSSDTVGGDEAAGDNAGLHEATGAMKDHFLLGQLASGQGAQVKLAVTLDGETQGNSYQDTLADLSMDFAVEVVEGTAQDRPTSSSTLSQTGDELALAPLFAVAAVAGVVLLIAAVYGRRQRKAEESEVQ